MKLFIGLDVSSEKLDSCILKDNPSMPILKQGTFPNSLIGASEIKKVTLGYAKKLSVSAIVIGMEAPSL